MNYRKDIQEIMEYLTHNNEEELKISYAELARRYNCDYRTIKNAINRIKNGAPKKKNNLSKSILDDYLKLLFPENYDYLHHILLIDYLENFKVKPKIWWDYIKIENREELFNNICMKIPSLSLELLYRYSVVLIYKNEVFLIIYKDFNATSYKVTL